MPDGDARFAVGAGVLATSYFLPVVTVLLCLGVIVALVVAFSALRRADEALTLVRERLESNTETVVAMGADITEVRGDLERDE